jgi:hypothetical protein
MLECCLLLLGLPIDTVNTQVTRFHTGAFSIICYGPEFIVAFNDNVITAEMEDGGSTAYPLACSW